MRYKVYSVLLVLLIVAVAVMAVAGVSWPWMAGGCAVLLLVLGLQIRSVRKPLNAVQNGMYLLREQDFGSRLRRTGQADADRIVELYNTLMASMKAERLRSQEQERFLSDFDGNSVKTNRAWDAMQSPVLTAAIDGMDKGTTETVRLADALIVRISRLWFMDSGFRREFVLVERLTEEIAAAEKQMFNKIVRTIGHEVNNTLGSVVSVLESLGEMHEDDPLTAAAIAGSVNSCANLAGFVRGYADIVKLPPVTQESIDLSAWLSKLHPTLAGMAPSNISISLIPADSCVAMIDPMLMERVIINIVKNAIESIGDRPDGKVEIKVSRGLVGSRPYTAMVTVTDNGRGISSEAAEKLFTPFFSTKRPDRGLGLMLIADILRAHNARFSLSTDPSTRLTTFTIAL